LRREKFSRRFLFLGTQNEGAAEKGGLIRFASWYAKRPRFSREKRAFSFCFSVRKTTALLA